MSEDLVRSAALRLVCASAACDPAQLVLDTHLEGELGIYGGERDALFASLRTELQLPATALSARIATVRHLLDAVVDAAQIRPPTRASGTQDRILAVVHRHTHYELDVLQPDADLEGELGVDSVLLASIVADVSKEFQLPKAAIKVSAIRTIGDLVSAAENAGAAPGNDNAVSSPAVGSAELRPGERDGEPHDEDDGDERSMQDFTEERDRDLFAKVRSFGTFLEKRRREHLYWYGMPLETACNNRAIIYDEITGKRREFLMFASNNYLGLANHPRVIEAICTAARAYGATNTGCRLIGGTNVVHKELEQRLAAFKGREACIVYPSGYSANLGVISALVKKSDAVLTDKYNHMSILDGCRLSGASRKIYRHNDMADLERVLERTASQVDGMLIVTDGVFSMHGDICRLPEIRRLAAQYGAKTLVDDAHATGVLGARGSGTAEHFGLKGEVDLELGTMSKALGGLGGFVAADRDVIEYLRFYSNSYVFAATIPAATAAGLIASLDVLEGEPERLTKLWANVRRFKEHLLAAGFDLGESASAVIPVVIGDDRLTLRMGRAVRARGLFCQTVVYPGVALGDARLRISVSSEHTDEDLDLAAQILVDAAREVGLEGRDDARR